MEVKELISKLSLEEKFSLLAGKNDWETAAVERLGIPSIFLSDGPHGLRKMEVGPDGKVFTVKAFCFPNSSAMAATWNPKLAGEIGKALGEECRAMGVGVLLGPGTNIKRTPLCGRNFEYYSEDPLLAGELAAAYIAGVQSEGVGTSLKHFATNNQEYNRLHISSEVDIRALREIYLKPFEIAVKKSQPATVMCAYNRLNGVYCSENKFLLDDVLKKEWGFEGIVVSDWGAVHDRAKALNASLDLEMPFKPHSAGVLKEAYANGVISDDEINAALERLLPVILKISREYEKRGRDFDPGKHHQLAKEAAREAITLLKNENGVLPINKEKVKKLVVIGEFAKDPIIQGGGSARVQTNSVDSPLEKIMELAGKEIEVEFVHTYNTRNTCVNQINKALEAASDADMALVFVGNRHDDECESFDRERITLSPELENIILSISSQNPNTVVVVEAGSAVDMSRWIEKVKAVVFTWYTGQAGAGALAEILFGLANPCGKIAETFPVRIEDTPTYGTYPGNGFTTWYPEGIMVGYRYYDTYQKEVLFPFGFGLSYTTFTYSDLTLSPVNASEDETVTVSFKVKNTGEMKGKEIVQLYVRDKVCKVLRPDKELKAFDKIELLPGEEKEVRLKLTREAFAYFNTSLNAWHVESGKFEILVGSSSRDIKLAGTVNIKSENDFS